MKDPGCCKEDAWTSKSYEYLDSRFKQRKWPLLVVDSNENCLTRLGKQSLTVAWDTGMLVTDAIKLPLFEVYKLTHWGYCKLKKSKKENASTDNHNNAGLTGLQGQHDKIIKSNAWNYPGDLLVSTGALFYRHH